MKIAIDVSPLQTGHKIRGTGFYLKNLQTALLKYHPENTYIFFTKKEEIPFNVDIVHYPYFDPFFITLPLTKRYKTIVTVHDLTPLVFPHYFPAGLKGKLKWQIQKSSLKKIDTIITDSESSKKDITKYADISESKMNTVYLAAGEEFKKIENLKLKREIRKKYNLPDKFALYVGDVTWNKNLPRLIRAINEINVPLVMVGKTLTETNFDKTNPWNQDLVEAQKLIAENKLITPLGFVPTEDLVMLYNCATVFVMPSIYEGFGLPILEAMQSGCPVITTREGSIPEVAGEAAMYVEATDIKSIAKGITEVFNNSQLQKQLSEKGLKQAKKFSWENTAEKTIEAYKKA